MPMFFNSKKIREFLNKLDASKRPQDIEAIVKAVKKHEPKAAAGQFQKSLKAQMLAKHKELYSSKSSKVSHLIEDEEETPVASMGWRSKGWSFALALFLVITISGLVSYPLIPAPQVEGYSLKENVRQISDNAPVKIAFTQPMDRASVEANFEISPQVSGRFEWNNNSLLYFPDQKLPVGQTYSVSVGKGAKSLLQKNLEYDYEEQFEITGPPQVKMFNPADKTENVPVDAKITVLFDRPMVALASLDKGEELLPNITIEPKIDGRFKWLSTNSVQFIPKDRLAYSTAYTVRIPKGTKSADGGAMEEDFVMTFSTTKPFVNTIYPLDMSQYNGSSTLIKVEFNQPVSPQKAQSFVELYKFKDGQKFDNYSQGAAPLMSNFDSTKWEKVDFMARNFTLEDYRSEQKDIEALNWLPEMEKDAQNIVDDQPDEATVAQFANTLVLEPSTKLSLGSLYFVKVNQGLSASEGTFTIEYPAASLFMTVIEPKVTGSYPANGTDLGSAEWKKSGQGNYISTVELSFNHPIVFSSVYDKVVLSPLHKDQDTQEDVQPNVNPGYEGTSLSITYNFKPSTEYTVTLKAGGTDLYGQKIAQDFTTKFTTAPLDPRLNLASASDLSVLDFNKAPVYYLKSVNISSANVRFRKLTEDEFKNVYREGYVDGYALNAIQGPFSEWSKKLNKEFNKEVVSTLDLNAETDSKLAPGFYFLDVSSPEVVDSSRQPIHQKQVFIVSDTALALKRSSKELMVWATTLKDGAPQEGVSLDVFNRGGEKILSGITDKQGLATFTLPEVKSGNDYYDREYTVMGHNGDNVTMAHSSWSEGVAPWNFNIDFDAFQAEYYVYSYTDRPIYRPGHTVYFKGLVRKDSDAEFLLPKVKNVHVRVTDNNASVLYEKDLPLNSNGSFNGEMALGEQARTGYYSIETSIPELNGPEYLNHFYTAFRIAEYRKPDYELTLKPDKENYANGDKALVTVKGAYFFGAPMPNAPIEYTLKSQDYYFFLDSDSDSPFASQWYSFSDDGYFCYWGCEGQSEVVSSGKAKLNDKGEYVLELPLDISKKKVSQFYTLEVTAHDLNNQTVSNRVTLPVHSGEFYVGILNQDYVTNQGQPANFDVVSVDYDGKPLPNTSVEVSLYKRTWNTVKKKNVDSDFYYENSYDDTLIETKSATTDDKGHTVVALTPNEGGVYKAEAKAKDSKGNTIVASTTIYVSSQDFVNWGRENNDKIELVADKNEYKLGDTAHILVKSPYQNVWALVTQERQNILDKKIVKITSNSQTIDIPITEKSLPNVFVSVILVKGSDVDGGLGEPKAGDNDERNVAAFKMGYATLQVDTSSKELHIEVKPDKQKYRPGEEVTLSVQTVDSENKPAKAEVSLAVVDKSVLSLTETVTADLLNSFYRKRFLGVETAETLTKALSRVNIQVEAGLKGGGGANAKKRGVFKDTAHWEAIVNTDESGNGVVKFKLPDNLTTWQILAIGITPDTLVGSQKTDFLVTKDVLVRPVLPRFMISNDNMTIGGVVHNYLDKEMRFAVKLEAEGVKINGATEQTVTLKAGDEQKVLWNIDVLNLKEAKLIMSATSTSDAAVGDIVEQVLPIQPYSFPEVVATAGVIQDDKKQVETVWLPEGVDRNLGELTVSVAPTLATSITQGLEYLMRYPYGCVEQVTSALLPNIVIKQTLDLPGLKNKLIDEKELQKNVEAGVAALYKYQQGNGGWGVWETSQTNPYLSAYVLSTLYQARTAGFAVDETVLSRGLEYLRNYMSQTPLLETSVSGKNTFVSTQPTMISSFGGMSLPAPDANGNGVVAQDSGQLRYEANIRAFMLYVLSQNKLGDVALTNNLYDKRDRLSIFGKAYLAMAYGNFVKEAPDADLQKKIDTLKQEILNEAKETPRGVHFEERETDYRLFDTNTRTTALVLQMLSNVDPGHPYIPKILRHLLMEKKDGRYISTQETAVTLLAMVDYLRSSKELEANYNGVVNVTGVEKIHKSFTTDNIGDHETVTVSLNDLLPDNQDNEITFVRNGAGKMYYDMNLKYYLPTEQIQPRDEGITVDQEYFETDDKSFEKPVKEFVLGKNYKAKMTLVVPEDRYYVMLEDYLPAGLEGIDFSLNTSQQGLQNGSMMYEGKGGWWDSNLWYFNHSEVRDDRVMYFADSLPKGVYEIEYFVRATTPGKFHDLPALAQELYFPEVFGRSKGDVVEVKES